MTTASTQPPDWYEDWMASASELILNHAARIEQNEKLIARMDAQITRMDAQIEQGKRDAEKTRRLWIAVARQIGLDEVDFDDNP